MFLHPHKRAALLASLANAPDEILLDAVRQYMDWQNGIHRQFKDVSGFIGMKEIEAPKPTLTPPKAEVQVPSQTERPNVDPGPPTITKMGVKTREQILANVAAANKVRHWFNEHLRLLWAQGEVKFDGKEYYK